MLSPWFCEAGRTDCRDHDRSGFRRWRLQDPTRERTRGFWDGLGGLALLAGMVEEGTMACVESTRNYVRKDCRELSYALSERCERPHSAMPDMAETRCRHHAWV